MESSESVPAEVEGESSRVRDARRVALFVAEALIASIVLEAAGYVTMAVTTSQQGSVPSYEPWEMITAALFWLGPITVVVLLAALGLSWWVLAEAGQRGSNLAPQVLRGRRDVRVLRIAFILIVVLAALNAVAGIRLQGLTSAPGTQWGSLVQFVAMGLSTALLGVVGVWASGACLARSTPVRGQTEDESNGA